LSSLLKFNDVNFESHQFVYTDIFVDLDSNQPEEVKENKVPFVDEAEKYDPNELIKADHEAKEILEADRKEKTADDEFAKKKFMEAATKLAEADREAQEIINSAKMYASKIRLFARKKAELEYEESKSAGFREGYEAGKEIALRENNDNVEELKRLLKLLDDTKAAYIENTRQELINLTFEIAEKIIGAKLDKNDSTFISIFKNAVKDLTAQKWVKLSVSEQDYEFATENAELLRKFISGAETIEIDIFDNAPEGTCIIETNEKILDASVKTQLESLYNAVANS
jgi:flagellar assembly protein FliH